MLDFSKCFCTSRKPFAVILNLQIRSALTQTSNSSLQGKYNGSKTPCRLSSTARQVHQSPGGCAGPNGGGQAPVAWTESFAVSVEERLSPQHNKLCNTYRVSLQGHMHAHPTANTALLSCCSSHPCQTETTVKPDPASTAQGKRNISAMNRFQLESPRRWY